MNDKIINELSDLIEEFYSACNSAEKNFTTINISDDKWSLNQIIGHLIDSASNNHQRFVRLQIDLSMSFPDYNADQWLDIQKYNKFNFEELVNLFYYYNKLILNIIKFVNKDTLGNTWKINWSNDKNTITLEELIIHYITHIKGHLKHFKERLKEIKKYKKNK